MSFATADSPVEQGVPMVEAASGHVRSTRYARMSKSPQVVAGEADRGPQSARRPVVSWDASGLGMSRTLVWRSVAVARSV